MTVSLLLAVFDTVHCAHCPESGTGNVLPGTGNFFRICTLFADRVPEPSCKPSSLFGLQVFDELYCWVYCDRIAISSPTLNLGESLAVQRLS